MEEKKEEEKGIIFWVDGDYTAQGGVFVRNDLCEFFKKLKVNNLTPVGIKVDLDSHTMEIFTETIEPF